MEPANERGAAGPAAAAASCQETFELSRPPLVIERAPLTVSENRPFSLPCPSGTLHLDMNIPFALPEFRCLSIFLATLLLVAVRLPAADDSNPTDHPEPLNLTAAQDHQRMMDLLHITSLRRGADGMNPQSSNYQNTDESKANPYPNLPDPLLLKNGKKVTTPETWWKERRPEIM